MIVRKIQPKAIFLHFQLSSSTHLRQTKDFSREEVQVEAVGVYLGALGALQEGLLTEPLKNPLMEPPNLLTGPQDPITSPVMVLKNPVMEPKNPVTVEEAV